jgi:hypothetical protein
MRIQTKDAAGNPNGWVLPVWNSRESDYRPAQVYVTVIAPLASKGPHLHHKRAQCYQCISGFAHLITRESGEYITQPLSPFANPVIVPPGVPSELRNVLARETILLNLPTVGWAPDDQDEWPVENWHPDD